MFRDLPRYADSTSNSFWLSRTPSHWRVQPGLAVLQENRRKNNGLLESQVLSLSYGRVVVKPVEKQRGLVPESYEGYQILDPGDIVVRPTDLQNDQTSIRIGHVKNRGIITSAYIGLRPSGGWSDAYAYQYLTVVDSSKRIYGMGSGLRQQLGWSDLKRMPCLVPPAEEQAAIVKYLAHANARIDNAIAAKRGLLSLLEEQLATRIGAAFGRPDDRDSHRLRAFTGRPITGITPSTTESRYFENGTVDWHGPSSFSADLFLGAAARKVADAAIDEGAVRLLRSPSLLVVAIGATCGKSAIVLESTCTNQQVVAFSLDLARCDPEFIGYQAKSLERKWRGFASTATIPMISTEVLRSSSFWLPPLEEQREIAGSISDQRTKKSNAARRIDREIYLLKEFRTRLVADVVTGQVDVRAVAATLPDAPETSDNQISEPDDDLEEALSESEK